MEGWGGKFTGQGVGLHLKMVSAKLQNTSQLIFIFKYWIKIVAKRWPRVCEVINSPVSVNIGVPAGGEGGYSPPSF